MLFNSYKFILAFFPLTLAAYFAANKFKAVWGKIVLIASGVIFYTCLDLKQFIALGISLIVNFTFAVLIRKRERVRLLFLTPILVNIALLLHFKYTNFFIEIANKYGGGVRLEPAELILPLGISFFTFQQIAYVTAVYKKEIVRLSLIDYLAYILYFPKLLMGPLMEPTDFLNQLNDKVAKKINMDNIACGLKLFSLGLFKKAMLADVFAKAVSWGFSNVEAASAADLMLTALFYTFEIYFDFSGYSDMAVGLSQMLNIILPINFNSPYKALSIRDFWKRWHISLTNFLTKYVYIPLGGSKKGNVRTCINTMIVFLLSGLWHGANYTFILWGALHGIFMLLDRACDKIEKRIFEPVRWGISFCIINMLWLLFRAESIGQWKTIIKTIIKLQSTAVSDGLISCFVLPEMQFLEDAFCLGWSRQIRGFWMLVYIVAAMGLCLIPENNYKTKNTLSIGMLLIAALAFVWGLICLSSESVFVYFNF